MRSAAAMAGGGEDMSAIINNETAADIGYFDLTGLNVTTVGSSNTVSSEQAYGGSGTSCKCLVAGA